MNKTTTSRKISTLRKKATNAAHCVDDRDEKYSKIKESKDRMLRRVFTFIAIALMITTYVFFVTNSSAKTNNLGGGKLRGKLLQVVHGRRWKPSKTSDGFDTKKGDIPVNDHMSQEVLHDVIELPEEPSLEKLEQRRIELDQQVRDIKATGIIMETDKESLKVTKALQDVTRLVLKEKYGDYSNYRVKVDLEFQRSIPDFDKNGQYGTLVIEMAPIQYIPVSVYNWLEIARTWKSGAFHRNANHVLQATTNAAAVTKSLAFQEYSDKHPHKKGTVGYCGRPSGPCWYISIENNTHNHGPGSQQEKNPHEADANFGRIVSGMEDVVPRIHSVPQESWLDKKNQVFIKTMTILVPTGPGGAFTEWMP